MGIIISLTAFPVIIALILCCSGIVFSFWREVLQIPFWIRKLCRDRYCGSDCDLSDL